MLLEDPDLAFVMMHHEVPDARLLPGSFNRLEQRLVDKLGSIVDRFPKSSYADFARYALARHIVNNLEDEDLLKRADGLTNAHALLNEINTLRFVYAPQVLMLRLALAMDAESRKTLAGEIRLLCGDDKEWLRFEEPHALLSVLKVLSDSDAVAREIDRLARDVDSEDGRKKVEQFVWDYLSPLGARGSEFLARNRDLLPVQRGPRPWKAPPALETASETLPPFWFILVPAALGAGAVSAWFLFRRSLQQSHRSRQ